MIRSRWPALITTKAVITLVMLAIGRSVFRPRLHSSLPLAAFSTAADLAPTPAGEDAAAAAGAALAVRMALAAGTALAAGAVSAAHAARTAPARNPVTRTGRRTRAIMDTPLSSGRTTRQASQLRHAMANTRRNLGR